MRVRKRYNGLPSCKSTVFAAQSYRTLLVSGVTDHAVTAAIVVALSLSLNVVAVALVLGLELKVLVGGTEEHLTVATSAIQLSPGAMSLKNKAQDIPDLDPVLVIRTTQQRLQIIPPPKRRRSIPQPRRQMLQQTDRHVPTAEAQPLEQEPPRRAHANFIRAPILESIPSKLLDVPQPLRPALVQVLPALNLLEDPRLGQRAARHHDRVDARLG